MDRSEDRLRITHLSEDLRGESRLALGGDRLFEERHVLEELRRSAGARGRVSEGTSASSGRVSGEGSVRSREARSGSPEPVVHAPDIRGLARHAPHPARLAGRRASPPSPSSSHPCPPRLSSPRPRPCGRRTSVSRCDVAATENLRHLVQTRRSAHMVTQISSEDSAQRMCVVTLRAALPPLFPAPHTMGDGDAPASRAPPSIDSEEAANAFFASAPPAPRLHETRGETSAFCVHHGYRAGGDGVARCVGFAVAPSASWPLPTKTLARQVMMRFCLWGCGYADRHLECQRTASTA